MAEDLLIAKGTKEEQYQNLIPQIKALIDGEPDLVANLANIASAINYAFEFLWVGFYLVDGEELVLGPFQGPPACTRISKGKGVCGTSWATGETLVVPDVDAFPGHIACDGASNSEIVVPLVATPGDRLLGVLDLDSPSFNRFDADDQQGLEQLAAIFLTASDA